MRKIKMLETNEIVEVSANEAHTLIESGAAELYVPQKKVITKKKYKTSAKRKYSNKMMTSEE